MAQTLLDRVPFSLHAGTEGLVELLDCRPFLSLCLLLLGLLILARFPAAGRSTDNGPRCRSFTCIVRNGSYRRSYRRSPGCTLDSLTTTCCRS